MNGFEEKVREIKEELAATDKEMMRIIDDLITILVKKGHIRMSDFSEEAQKKLMKRSSLRESI